MHVAVDIATGVPIVRLPLKSDVKDKPAVLSRRVMEFPFGWTIGAIDLRVDSLCAESSVTRTVFTKVSTSQAVLNPLRL